MKRLFSICLLIAPMKGIAGPKDIHEIHSWWKSRTATRLVQARQAKGLSQARLAVDVAVRRSEINLVENAAVDLTEPFARTLAAALGVNREWLLGYDFLNEEFGGVNEKLVEEPHAIELKSFIALIREAIKLEAKSPGAIEAEDCARKLSDEVLITELERRGFVIRRAK